MSSVEQTPPDVLLNLAHELGSSAHAWAVLGEGNVSSQCDEAAFWVKASGSQLATLQAQQVARVLRRPVLDALASSDTYADTDVAALLKDATTGPAGTMPSVETLLHAFLLSLEGVGFVGHTHVTSINAMTCSAKGWSILREGRRMFPDEIVVCGEAPCCVDYVDPGVPLARELAREVMQYQHQYGCVPKTIYLQNHGFIAIGKTAAEVVAITTMADKAAQIAAGAMVFGGPTFMSEDSVRRIANRPDEHYRQKALGLR